ncbi:zinc carboxypeptidase-like isoform X1 [Diabrotica undecimpunctata]|uniref:zinc carboxypeptidase-like isoform X1 n=2 Tax=Diabrotica undecimpunctata TaxID=50387 RepID=UPI003B63B18F
MQGKMKLASFCVLVGLLSLSSAVVRYDNYTLYKLSPKTSYELKFLQNLQRSKEYKLDFWRDPYRVGIPISVLVSPEGKYNFENVIRKSNVEFQVLNSNVQEQIDKESRVSRLRSIKQGNLTWDRYYDLEHINNWLKKLAKDYPGKVTLIKVGKSFEKRDILGVKVSFGKQKGRRSVWLDSLIHAREWISGPTTTFILNEILHSKEPAVRAMAESHDWYIFPVLNPDGFVYSQTEDPMWRKTRSDYGTGCKGTDPNRNWGFKWNELGASNDPCSLIYAGPYAFSEIETKSLSKYMSKVANKILLYITFHSHGQYILLPYGHTRVHLDNYDEAYKLANRAAESLAQRYGTQYRVGSIADEMGLITGSSMDWYKKNYQIPFAYAYELRDQFTFELPKDQILPNCLEVLDSLVTLLKGADTLYKS